MKHNLIECEETNNFIRSNTWAKYKSQANVIAEIIWVQSLPRELGFFDNVYLVYDVIMSDQHIYQQIWYFHVRIKIVQIDFHFTRKRAAQKMLRNSSFLLKIK